MMEVNEGGDVLVREGSSGSRKRQKRITKRERQKTDRLETFLFMNSRIKTNDSLINNTTFLGYSGPLLRTG